jgi:hypothetical protein
MNDAIRKILDSYNCETERDYINSLRDILQRLALLGLWRSKFFEHAAFYGGTALRLLYGLDRFSEDLDFSLRTVNPEFSLSSYSSSLTRELESFGFNARIEVPGKKPDSPIESAFLKADTITQLLVIRTQEKILKGIPRGKLLKIKLEVDTEPPPDFTTETQFLLKPIPFPVRAFTLPDMFAGKLHAVLFRKWRSRVKGRDWYDLLWYAGHHPEVNLIHLEARMRQSGDYTGEHELTLHKLQAMLENAIEELNIDSAGSEVSPFVKNQYPLDAWSKELFMSAVKQIVPSP